MVGRELAMSLGGVVVNTNGMLHILKERPIYKNYLFFRCRMPSPASNSISRSICNKNPTTVQNSPFTNACLKLTASRNASCPKKGKAEEENAGHIDIFELTVDEN